MDNEPAAVIAWIALAVSGLSLVWTIVWSIVNYRLLGARLRVGLTLGLLTHRGTVATFTSSRRWPKKPLANAPISDSDLWAEIVKITVANTGRTVAWVSDLRLDFGRSSRWRPSRQRLSMTLQPLAVGGGRTDNSPVRLESGESASMYLSVADAISWGINASGRSHVRVRAAVTFAGVRVRRSPRRRSWRVSRASMAYPHLPLSKEVRLYRELLMSWPTSDLSGLYDAYLQVRVALDDPTRGQLVDILEPFVPNVMRRVTLAHRLEKIGPFPKIISRDDGGPKIEVVTDHRPADEREHGAQDAERADEPHPP